jgi:Ca2+-binding RTX toxin-like protein
MTVTAASSGPSVTLVDGVLKIVGTNNEDSVKIIRADSKYVVVSNFQTLNTMQFPVSQIQAIEIDVLGGNDQVDLSQTVLVPVTIRGGSGNDSIKAGGGNDLIYGGDGNDEIETGDGVNVVYAGGGNDKIKGGAGRDRVYAGEGNDELTGEGGDDLLFGGGGNDKLDGKDGNDVVSGGSGNDEIKGGAGRDVLIGGLGADIVKGENNDDILIANTVTFEEDEVALQMVLAEWASSRSYSVRVANLKGVGTGERLNGSVFLNSSSILNDNAIDILMGGKDQDWFVGTVSQDVFDDGTSSEQRN